MKHSLFGQSLLAFAILFAVRATPCFAIITDIVATNAVDCGKPVHGLAVAIKVGKTVFSPGEPILMNISLMNMGTNDISVRLDHPLQLYHMDVWGPDGAISPFTLYGRRERERIERIAHFGGSVFGIALPQGKEESDQIHLNRVFDLTLPGTYTVSVQRVVWVGPSLTNDEKAVSNQLKFSIEK